METVNCFNCGKEFKISPNRLKNKVHNCSKKCMGEYNSKRYSQKIIKQCEVCGKDLELKKSRINRQKHFTCSKSCRSKLIKEIYKGIENPNYKGNSDLEKIFIDRLKLMKVRALNKGFGFDIDLDYLKKIYKEQDGKCFYTNIPMIINGNRSYNTLSIDRIDSDKGYIKGNIVFCLLCINTFKSNHSINDINLIFEQIEHLHTLPINIKFKKIYEDSQEPFKKHKSDAGFDLFVHHIEDFGNFIKVFTGIAVCPPDRFYFELYPRSSIYKQGLSLYNSIGVIDNEYRGEIIAIFDKTKDFKELPKKGDRLVQIILKKQQELEFEIVESLENTVRNNGGFGSTNE